MSKLGKFLLVSRTLVIFESETRNEFGTCEAGMVMVDALWVGERSIPDDVGEAATEFFNSYRSGRIQPVWAREK